MERKVVYPKIKAWMAENGIKNKDFAKTLDITDSAISQKLNGLQEFSLNQARTICTTYNIPWDFFS